MAYGSYPEPAPEQGIAAHRMWERAIGRAVKQCLEHGTSLAPWERHFGKHRSQLEAIAGRFPPVAQLMAASKRRRR